MKKILYMSNYIPEEIIDVYRFNSYLGNVRIENYCTYAQNFIGELIENKEVAGGVIPNSCDSIRLAGEYVKEYTDKFIYVFKHPLKISKESVLQYAGEVEKYKYEVEKYFNMTISDAEIHKRISLLDKKYEQIKNLYNSLDSISYYEYINALNLSFVNKLEASEEILNKSISAVKNQKSNRIFLIGPYLSDTGIIKKVEEFGGNIVGDDLTNSKRYFSIGSQKLDIRLQNIFEDIAYRNLSKAPSPTLNNFKYILENDIHEIKNKKVDKVIFIYQKFCEPHEYIYPLLKEKLQDEGIMSLKIQLENNLNQTENFEMKLETFLSM